MLTQNDDSDILNITFRGGGGIGRHASLRCLWRKSWPFKSAPPHKRDCQTDNLFFFGECAVLFCKTASKGEKNVYRVIR